MQDYLIRVLSDPSLPVFIEAALAFIAYLVVRAIIPERKRGY